MPASPSEQRPPDLLHRLPFLLGLYLLICVAYALVIIPHWGWVYWDFGDGNYMYIARRVREGLVLYRDILAPQPPLHTLAGVAAEAIGEALAGSALIGVRVYTLAVRLLGGLVLLLLARAYFGCPFRALAVAIVYLTMPIGFWWSISYQSENLEILFLVLALLLLLRWDARWAAVAGVFSALACHTNMTGVPFFLANAVFLAFRRRRMLLPYAGATIGVYAVIAGAAAAWTDGAFLSNVLFNQVGTFPDSNILSASNSGDNFWMYAYRKITAEGMKVLELEGGFIAAALIGAVLAVRRLGDRVPEDEAGRAAWHRTEFMAWQLIAGLLSICFVAKGGTVNYIFVLGEPMVAFWAGAALVDLWRGVVPQDSAGWKPLSLFNTRPFLLALFPLLVLGIIYWPAVRNIRLTLAEVQVELPEQGVQELRAFITTYAEPGEMILAPPFYAFATDTIVAGELAENYIWNIKYMNETFYNEPAEATAKMEEIAGLLRERKVRAVLLDLAQTGTVPVIREALAEHYQQAEPEAYPTRNTRLGLFVPKDVTLSHPPLMPRPAGWPEE